MVIAQQQRAARDRADEIDSALRRSGLPVAYRTEDRSFSDIRDEVARELVRLVIASDTRGAYLWGPAGPDKTTTAAVALAQHIRSGGSGRFVAMADLVTDILASYRQDATITRAGIVTPLIDTPALVLDDLGKERASEHTAAVLYQILDGRYRQLTPKSKRWLIVTSNLSIDEIAARFPDDLGEPIARRLSELCEPLRMEIRK